MEECSLDVQNHNTLFYRLYEVQHWHQDRKLTFLFTGHSGGHIPGLMSLIRQQSVDPLQFDTGNGEKPLEEDNTQENRGACLAHLHIFYTSRKL